MYQFDFPLMEELFLLCLGYVPITVYIASMTVLIGIVLGALLAMARMSHLRLLRWPSKAYILVMRGIPPVLLLIILYNLIYRGFDALAQAYGWGMTSAVIPKTAVAILALSLGSTAFMAESIRTALLSVQNGQREAAYSIGMTKWDAMRRIFLPQAFPVAIPIVGSNFINLLKATALVNLVGVVDVLNAAIIRINTNYKYLEAYLTTAVIYWLLTVGIEMLVKHLSKWATRRVGMEALT